MKNKLFFFFVLIYLLSVEVIRANEDFSFESKSIEISNTDQKITAKDGVIVNTSDNMQLFGKEATYNKITDLLEVKNDVIILDKIKNLELSGQYLIYDKKNEIINIKDNVILIDKNRKIQINGKKLNIIK